MTRPSSGTSTTTAAATSSGPAPSSRTSRPPVVVAAAARGSPTPRPHALDVAVCGAARPTCPIAGVARRRRALAPRAVVADHHGAGAGARPRLVGDAPLHDRRRRRVGGGRRCWPACSGLRTITLRQSGCRDDVAHHDRPGHAPTSCGCRSTATLEPIGTAVDDRWAFTGPFSRYDGDRRRARGGPPGCGERLVVMLVGAGGNGLDARRWRDGRGRRRGGAS